ncbi:MBL fold metallo-hydrolase [Oceanobacillus damuensis]|uniref:MBL fold metallo-hydrolase n=1 Tax=Oceanobacillus damuensis TaxID=937928 RepID=UPI00083723F1|nr:MBL fold metallo-hydrolase [Oceanobacillus damuensis]
MHCRVIGMWGGFPKKNGPCSGFLIQQDGFSLLLDCGSGVVPQLQNYIDLNEINHVVLSHYHYDHFSDIGVMLFSRLVNTQLKRADKPLSIYGPLSEEMERRVEEVPHSKFAYFNEKSKLEIGPFTLEFKKNSHPVEAYSIKITSDDKTIVFTSDTTFTEDLIPFSSEADLLIAECSLYEEMDGSSSGHMTSKEAGILAKQSNAKNVILTHLPHYGDLNELLENAKKQGNPNIKLADVGMVVEV